MAELFQGANFEHEVKVRIDRQVDWKQGLSPDKAVPLGAYSIRWTGWLKAPRPGRYKLVTHVDDGARLRLDGKLLIDEWHAAKTLYTCAVELTGKPQALQIDYFEMYEGTSMMRLHWEQEGGFPAQPVPAEALSHDRVAWDQAVARQAETERVFFAVPLVDARGYLLLAEAHFARGEYDLAQADYRRWALVLRQRGPDPKDPNTARYYNDLGWRLATGREAQGRYAEAAVVAATRCCQMTSYNGWGCLDTLAAAYADAGNFVVATQWQLKALSIAPVDQKAATLSRLKLYQSGKPYREDQP